MSFIEVLTSVAEAENEYTAVMHAVSNGEPYMRTVTKDEIIGTFGYDHSHHCRVHQSG